jgi:CheY-like chemotaxis protein
VAAQRVAVIDSDEAYLRFVSYLLHLEGFPAYSISSSEGAMDRLLKESPDAIILDSWLEDREAGWALLEALLDEPRLRSIPIVLATSDPSMAHLRRILLQRHHRLVILEKPFAPDMLVAQLKRILTGKHRPAA